MNKIILATVFLISTVALSGCVLQEGQQYSVEAGRGIYVHFYKNTTTVMRAAYQNERGKKGWNRSARDVLAIIKALSNKNSLARHSGLAGRCFGAGKAGDFANAINRTHGNTCAVAHYIGTSCNWTVGRCRR